MRWMALLHRHRTCQSSVVTDCKERSHPMTVKAVGLDLAKDVFQVHCVSGHRAQDHQKEDQAGEASGIFLSLAEMCGRHGSLRIRASLGPSVAQAGPRCLAYVCRLCQTLCEAWQD